MLPSSLVIQMQQTTIADRGTVSSEPAAALEAEEAGFPLFPTLPFELRLQIWEYLCFIPRVIDIRSSTSGLECFQDEFHEQPWFYHTESATIPAVLHTSHEARAVGLDIYSLHYGTEFDMQANRRSRASVELTTPPRIYINWACDIICPLMAGLDATSIEYTSLHRLPVKAEMQRLALDVTAIIAADQRGQSGSELQWISRWLQDSDVSHPQREIIIYCWPDPRFPPKKGAFLDLVELDDPALDIITQLSESFGLARLIVRNALKGINDRRLEAGMTVIPTSTTLMRMEVSDDDGTHAACASCPAYPGVCVSCGVVKF